MQWEGPCEAEDFTGVGGRLRTEKDALQETLES